MRTFAFVGILLFALAPAAARAEPTSRYTRPTGEVVEILGRVNLNEVPITTLERLPGMTPELAAAIVVRRDLKGPYKAPEEVLLVRGMTPEIFNRLGPHFSVEGPTRLEMRESEIEHPKPPVEGVVNLNTATAVDLIRLPGIDGARAEAILALRRTRGGFRAPKEIREAFGITSDRYAAVRPYLTVEGPTTLRELRERSWTEMLGRGAGR